jgi:hypothetical protein
MRTILITGSFIAYFEYNYEENTSGIENTRKATSSAGPFPGTFAGGANLRAEYHGSCIQNT